jgi:hypothetical protein
LCRDRDRPKLRRSVSRRRSCDGSLVEQEYARVCLRALRARFGSLRHVERSLPLAHSVMVDVMFGRAEVSTVIAFRVVKVLDTSIYDVIAERALPDDTCRSCGKRPSEHWRCAGEEPSIGIGCRAVLLDVT